VQTLVSHCYVLGEPAVAVRLGVPAAGGGIGCQGLGVDVPGRKHGQVTDVERKLGQCSQMLAYCQAPGASARWMYPSAVTAASLASQRRLAAG